MSMITDFSHNILVWRCPCDYHSELAFNDVSPAYQRWRVACISAMMCRLHISDDVSPAYQRLTCRLHISDDVSPAYQRWCVACISAMMCRLHISDDVGGLTCFTSLRTWVQERFMYIVESLHYWTLHDWCQLLPFVITYNTFADLMIFD